MQIPGAQTFKANVAVVWALVVNGATVDGVNVEISQKSPLSN